MHFFQEKSLIIEPILIRAWTRLHTQAYTETHKQPKAHRPSKMLQISLFLAYIYIERGRKSLCASMQFHQPNIWISIFQWVTSLFFIACWCVSSLISFQELIFLLNDCHRSMVTQNARNHFKSTCLFVCILIELLKWTDTVALINLFQCNFDHTCATLEICEIVFDPQMMTHFFSHAFFFLHKLMILTKFFSYAPRHLMAELNHNIHRYRNWLMQNAPI